MPDPNDQGQGSATPQGGDKPITMTQAELDAIIESRLARDRTARGQELLTAKQQADALQAKLAEADAKMKELETANATAAASQKTIEETLAGLEAAIPEDKRKRIPELPPDKKIRFIVDNSDLFFANSLPTPVLPTSPKPPVAPAPETEVRIAKTPREARELMLGGGKS